MGNVDYTATGLITAIQRKGLLPNTAEALAPADYYALMWEEMQTYLVPLLMSVREEYYVTTLVPDLAFTSATDTYPLPYRAMAGKLRQVQIQLSSGSSTFVPLPRVEPERQYNYATSGSVDGYSLEGNNLVLVPSPMSSGTIRMKYFMRPNQPVDSSTCAQITAINTGTHTLTFASLPATFTTSTPLDLINGQPPFDLKAFDQTPTAVTATTLQFSSLPSPANGQGGTLAVGDWVALAQQSPIPQIPYELFPLLSQAVVCAVLEAIGDKTGLQVALAKRDRLETKLLTLLQPRTEGSARVLINYYGPGFARIGRFRRR